MRRKGLRRNSSVITQCELQLKHRQKNESFQTLPIKARLSDGMIKKTKISHPIAMLRKLMITEKKIQKQLLSSSVDELRLTFAGS